MNIEFRRVGKTTEIDYLRACLPDEMTVNF